MRSRVALVFLSGLLLAGCGAARNVAVTSFRVIDAPAHFVRRQIDRGDGVTTPSTQPSDVATPGYPVTAPTPLSNSRKHSATASSGPVHRPSPPPSSGSTRIKPSASASARPAATPAAQFPTAKPVPGKPGYVYSVDPKGGIVDVTGYKSGDKAKDPYTQKIFVVP